jgi:hypothetical protein
MARDENGVIRFEQNRTEQFNSSGAVMGPFAGNGVESVAVYADFTSGTGASGNVTLQRAGESPRTPDDGINWVTVNSISANGEIQSGLSIASLYRVVVNVMSGEISVSWVSGSRSL